MQQLAKTHRVVLPISYFERQNNVLYNSVTVIDADGSILGTYRKSHIPDGTGYQEKFYFTPGDTGFRVFTSRIFGFTIGVAICWDQWFPEAARAMALQGADVLMYPTAIGTEPQDPTIDSVGHWQRVMQGHAAANVVPVVASNRYGTEILLSNSNNNNNNNNNENNNKPTIEKQRITFYGRSFITDATGAIVKEVVSMNNDDMQQQDQQQQEEEKEDHQRYISIIASTIDPEANRAQRLAWGLFRDRRPELYGILQTKDGSDGMMHCPPANKQFWMGTRSQLTKDSPDRMVHCPPAINKLDGTPRMGTHAHLTPTKRKRKGTSFALQGNCRVCRKKTKYLCSCCQDEAVATSKETWICSTEKGRLCFSRHLQDVHGS
ncbi:hydrolase [Nitzschia inconspicua]|nr:hydrolase [Nitzschia inconspicua]